jgi:tetratricopeptide (TPR) repeat protein
MSPREREFLIGKTIDDFYYVVNHANRLPEPTSFRMLPEMYYRIGESHTMLGQISQAIAAYEKSREIKRDYWPPYIGHARLLEKAGQRQEALRVLEEGLRFNRGEANLSALYTQLGGKSAFVRPAPAPASGAASAAPPPPK